MLLAEKIVFSRYVYTRYVPMTRLDSAENVSLPGGQSLLYAGCRRGGCKSVSILDYSTWPHREE